jgi:hypothetical protein
MARRQFDDLIELGRKERDSESDERIGGLSGRREQSDRQVRFRCWPEKREFASRVRGPRFVALSIGPRS